MVLHRSLTLSGLTEAMNRRTLLRRFAVGGLATISLGATSRVASARAQPASPAPLESPAMAEVLWDTWGVPHVFSDDAVGLFFGFGWAQAHAHGDLLLRLYAEARGRSAEYYGRDALAFDQLVRTMGLPQRGGTWYGEQPATFRANIDAFAAGINSYAGKYPERLAEPGAAVLPITGADVFAHAARIFFEFIAGESEVLDVLNNGEERGSNGWAVAPSHTSDGHALLLANPHLPWSGEYTLFEAQLAAPDVYDAYGATLVGIPVLAMAFNDHLGWTHTVNTLDGADLYHLTPDSAGYRFDGAARAFETRTESIQVLQGDGTLQEETLTVRRSVHGPVVESGDEMLAIRCTAVDDWSSAAGALEQWWDMGRATNLQEFETALRRLQVPIYTVIYADRDGHVLSLFGGQAPVRPAGVDDWSSPVPGDTSASIWTEIHPYDDLPLVVDPPGGWVQNSNSAPWYTTYPLQLDPDAFPPDLATSELSLREIRGIRMLSENPTMSLEQMIELKHSSRFELADRVLDDLIAAANTSIDETAKSAAAVLSAWDREANADSTGVLLFAYWAMRVGAGARSGLFATPLDTAEPLTTPTGLANPQAAVSALIDAAKGVESAFGRLDVAWGDVARLQGGAADEPANGFSGNPYGVFRVLQVELPPIGMAEGNAAGGNQVIANGDDASTVGGTMIVNGGDSYIAAVEFAVPVRAQALVTYGNASQPGSPHIGDQLVLAARGELRPVWRTREEIKANLEAREILTNGNEA
jgi:acyl-homoserine-lactone acylase